MNQTESNAVLRSWMSRCRRSASASVVAAILVLILGTISSGQSQVATTEGTTDSGSWGTVLAVGDVNGDGTPDLAMGNPAFDAGSGALQGRVEVVDGATGIILLTVDGAAAGAEAGASLAMGMDIDGDGDGDLLIGMPGHDAGAGADQGRVEAWSVTTTTLIRSHDGSAAGDRLGEACALLGDWNADSQADYAMGSPGATTPAGSGAGLVTVASGIDGATLANFDGTQAAANSGHALAACQDANDDGLLDIVVGEPLFDGTAGVDTGAVTLVLSPNATAAFQAEGSQASAQLGTVVSGGDLNGDAAGDVVAGAPQFAGMAGAATGLIACFSGRDGTSLWSLEGAAIGDQLGASIAADADTNGDGTSDVAVGAPLSNSSFGAVQVLDGLTGNQLAALSESLAADQFGTSVAYLSDSSGSPRPELLVGSPGWDGIGTDRGRVLSYDLRVGSDVHNVPLSLPAIALSSQVADLDQDGDGDLVLLLQDRVHIRWTGDQSGTAQLSPLFETRAEEDHILSVGSTAVSLATGNLDGDAELEIVVGRADGAVDIFDPTGSPGSMTYVLTTASPLLVDPNAATGSISGVAITSNGMNPVLVCAGSGTLVFSGFLLTVSSATNMPVVNTPLLTGGSFTTLAIADIDDDGNADILAGNSSSGPSGGLHVLLQVAGFMPATGSPYATPMPPSVIVPADLLGHGAQKDVVIVGTSLTASGVRILENFSSMSGFAATVDPGFTTAIDAVLGVEPITDEPRLAIVDVNGTVQFASQYSSRTFMSVTSLASQTAPVSSVSAGAISGVGILAPDQQDDFLFTYTGEAAASAAIYGATASTEDLPTSGCPSSGLAIVLHGLPIPGNESFVVELTGATPNRLAFIVAWMPTPLLETPFVSVVDTCGIAMVIGNHFQLNGFVDATGSLTIPALLPADPNLLGSELLLQFGVLDGGPVLGVVTASPALFLRIGI